MAQNLGTVNCTSMESMNGVRLCGVQADLSKDVIHRYLTTKGLNVKKILHPLHNNDFVVFFKDSKDAAQALCEKHLNFTVHPLPHKACKGRSTKIALETGQDSFTGHVIEVFSKVTVKLEEEISAFYLSTPDFRKKVREVTGGQLEITDNGMIVTMAGDMYDIELAQNVLSRARESQFRIQKEVVNGHDQDLVDALERSKREPKRKGTDIRGRSDTSEKKSAAERVRESSQGGDNSRHSPREQVDECSLSNGLDIAPGTGFSFSRMSSVEEHNSGRNSRVIDESKTFKHFTSIQTVTPAARHSPADSPSSVEQDILEARKLGAATRNSLTSETRGAVDGSSYPLSMTEGERRYLLTRDKNDLSSFGSTFVSEASMIRDLDNAPREELDAIEKWVHDTRSVENRPDTRGKEDGDETYPMSYESKQRVQEEFDVSNSSATMGLDDHHIAKGSRKSNTYTGNPLGVTEDVTAYSFSLPGGVKVMVYCGNIVKVKTEGIVNAANSELRNYAGVAGAIERACGPTMKRECERHVRHNGPLNISEVMHTSAGELHSTAYIIHTVGPVYVSTLDDHCGNLLTMTFLRCLDHARKKLQLHSLAFPYISTGVYGAPIEMCIESFLDAVVMFSNSHQSNPILTEIHLVNTDLEMVQTAIVMIKQHMEQGLDVLVAKAMSRIQEKGSQSAWDDRCSKKKHRKQKEEEFIRSSRSDRREQKAVRRTSSLTRDGLPRSSQAEDLKRWADYRNSETGSLRQEDVLNREETETTSHKYTPHRQRSGSFDSPGGRSSARDRPISAGSATGSGSGRKPASSSKSGLSQTIQDFKYVGNQLGTKDKFKPRPGTATGLNSPRNRSGPMRATNSVSGSGTDADFQNTEDHTIRIRQMLGEESYHSLPVDVNRSNRARTLPVPSTSDQETCAICMDHVRHPYKLEKCGHVFCKECIAEAFKTKPACPVCGKLYGAVNGDQPKGGKMSHSIYTDTSIPGYRDARGVIAIEYSFPSGTQEVHHPNPGKRYAGMSRLAYLPNNREGREVLRLLEKAFKAGVTFTIGESRTTGHKGVITWNDIHHKTSLTGGSTNFGYPDEGYLKRVKEELAAKGITG